MRRTLIAWLLRIRQVEWPGKPHAAEKPDELAPPACALCPVQQLKPSTLRPDGE